MVGLVDRTIRQASKMILFGVKGRLLTKLATLDQKGQLRGIQHAIAFWGLFGKHVLFFGLESPTESVHLYVFNPQSGELRELEDKAVESLEKEVWRFERLGNKLYYTGSLGKIMELSLTV